MTNVALRAGTGHVNVPFHNLVLSVLLSLMKFSPFPSLHTPVT